jgi:hypothetical protein
LQNYTPAVVGHGTAHWQGHTPPWVTALGIVIDLIGPINIGDEAQLKAASKPVSLSNGPLHKFSRNKHTFFSKKRHHFHLKATHKNNQKSPKPGRGPRQPVS